MSSLTMRGVRRALVLLAAGTIIAGGASSAPAQLRPGAVPDSGTALRGYLTTLADNPRSLDALIGAGRAALDMGDAEAALTFFGRANEVSGRNARVKAGMATALVQLGQAQTALSFFSEASALGAPEVEIAGDRGLAYDMMGHTRRAQQDYVAALRRRDDSEVRRRLALSLAISGERDAALRLIDPQLRRNDRAAWRVQAFILALTGDAAGASRTIQRVMPSIAHQMAPFLVQLAALSPAQKAMAVHLGHFPHGGRADGSGGRFDTTADPAAMALAMAGAPAPRPATQAAQPAQTAASRTRRPSNETRTADRGSASVRRPPPDSSDRFGLRRATRRSVRETSSAAPPESDPGPAEVAALSPRWAGSPYPQPSSAAPVRAPASGAPPPAAAEPPPARTMPPAEPVRTVRAVPIPASTPGQGSDSALTQVLRRQEDAEPGSVPAPAAGESGASLSLAPSSVPAETPSLADVAAFVNALPREEDRAAASPPPSPVRTAEARTTASRASRPEPPANPSRHWVQIAGGIDRASLPREFARLRGMAPEQLRGRAAYAAPMRTTSRLLVGPFASAREAQDFVNQLAARDVSAFAWTSAAGQEIERLPAR